MGGGVNRPSGAEAESGQEEQIVGKHISGLRPKAGPVVDLTQKTRAYFVDAGRCFMRTDLRSTIPETPEALLMAEAVAMLLQEGRYATQEQIQAVMDRIRAGRAKELAEEARLQSEKEKS